LIKRSFSILVVMAKDVNCISEEVLELIWSCCHESKHEDIVRATYELVTDLIQYMTLDTVKWVYKKV
jgi:hypothetical protein